MCTKSYSVSGLSMPRLDNIQQKDTLVMAANHEAAKEIAILKQRISTLEAEVDSLNQNTSKTSKKHGINTLNAGKPKKARTMYLHYMCKEMPNKILPQSEITRILGDKWKKMDENAQQPYMEAVAQSKI